MRVSLTHKGLKFINMEGIIYISKDVVFNEDEFHFKTNFMIDGHSQDPQSSQVNRFIIPITTSQTTMFPRLVSHNFPLGQNVSHNEIIPASLSLSVNTTSSNIYLPFTPLLNTNAQKVESLSNEPISMSSLVPNNSSLESNKKPLSNGQMPDISHVFHTDILHSNTCVHHMLVGFSPTTFDISPFLQHKSSSCSTIYLILDPHDLSSSIESLSISFHSHTYHTSHVTLLQNDHPMFTIAKTGKL